MQDTSALYKDLLASDHIVETRLAIGETGVLITKFRESITFGGVSILVGSSGADGGYDESVLISMSTRNQLFSTDGPSVGCCVSGEIDIEMINPYGDVPRQARLVPYVRLTDGKRHSEWIQKGVFYVDTRQKVDDGSSVEKVTIHGYDSMLKAEQLYPSSKLRWPALDVDVVREIAEFMGISVDSRTISLMKHRYLIQYPGEYYCREVLAYIAAMYAGCFTMSDLGELRLVAINSIPPETRYLITATGQAITFGGDRILV